MCGFVKGLMEEETTADLFAQYQAQFNAWFDSIKDQLTGDLAVRLQLEFDQLNVIAEQAFVFTNRVCQISDSKVTANSLIDVYFTAETIGAAEEAQIYVDSSAGTITLTATQQPSSAIRGSIRVRVRS